MLQASGQVVYVNEPLNIRHSRGVLLRNPAACRYPYLTPENDAEYLHSFERLVRLDPPLWSAMRQGYWPADFSRAIKYSKDFLVGRIRGRRALLKDPLASFSMPWFIQRLGCDVAVIVRHPASVVSSHKHLGWTMDFDHLLRQRQLCQDWLGPFVEEMTEMLKSPKDVVGQTSLLWRIIYHVATEQKKKLPSIEIVRYEDLALDPVSQYSRLYSKLGLSMSEAARKAIERATSGASKRQSFAWSVSLTDATRTSFRPMDSRANVVNSKKNLSDEEMLRIRRLTEDVASLYYSDQDWPIKPAALTLK